MPHNILDFAVARPNGALEVDLARRERDRTATVREVTVPREDRPDGTVTRLTRLNLADKSLALARVLRFANLRLEGVRLGQSVIAMQSPADILDLAARKRDEMGL